MRLGVVLAVVSQFTADILRLPRLANERRIIFPDALLNSSNITKQQILPTLAKTRCY